MKLPTPIREALEATGLPWSFEHGKRHNKIYVAGRMIAVISMNQRNEGKGDKGFLNVIAAIRRRARQYHQENPQPSKETTTMTTTTTPATKANSLSDLPHLVKPEQMKLPEPTPQRVGGYKPSGGDNIAELIKVLRDIEAGQQIIMEQNTLIIERLNAAPAPSAPREPRRQNSQALIFSILEAKMRPGAHYHVTEITRILNESEEPKLVAPLAMHGVYQQMRNLMDDGKIKQVRRAVYEIIAPASDEAEK